MPERRDGNPMNSAPPDALLLLAPGCPHCPAILDGLARLVKDGHIGSLEVVNIAARPDRAAALGVRSVPWVRVGEFVLEGARSPQELAHWAAQVGTDEGVREYVSARLKDGALADLERVLAKQPHWLPALLPLIADPDTELHVRIGLGALFESMAGSPLLQGLVPALGQLSTHTDRRVRSDACHYLALSGSRDAIPYLRARLQDSESEVREIAEESLTDLAADP